jgi:nucleotide-binding universal stress UspA family protein
MTSTWLVGVDGSDNARRAADWAVEQARDRDVRMVILATWTAPLATNGMLPGTLALPNWSELEDELRRSTEQLAADLSRRDVDVEGRIAQGPAGRALVEASRHAQLLVVGARGLGRVKGLVLGSVSQHCVSQAVAPTAVIPPGVAVGPVDRIVVGYDGSTNARLAAQWALGFAARDTSVTFLDALPLLPSLPGDLVRERFPAEVAAAEAEFEAHMRELDPQDRAHHAFVIADPRVALHEASNDADLMVLGARGRGRLAAMLVGSTTTWMLNGATRATVVVPPTGSGGVVSRIPGTC